MKMAIKKMGLATAAVMLATQQTVAFAQQVSGIAVTYAPGTSTSIPTLSEWGMIGLGLLLAVVAVYTLRGKTGGKPLASVILAFVLAFGGLSGNNLIGEAQAAGVISADCPVDGQLCYMTNAAGGTVTTRTINRDIRITNSTGLAQTITGISTLSQWDVIGTPQSPSSVPHCTVTTTLQPGASCYIFNNGLT